MLFYAVAPESMTGPLSNLLQQAAIPVGDALPLVLGEEMT
jgi:hypothetical protein